MESAGGFGRRAWQALAIRLQADHIPPMSEGTPTWIPAGLHPGARVVAAMSGGVDSAVTAALLKRAGFDVVGVTLQLYDHGAARGRPGACCAGEDIHDARRVADQLGFPHYVLDYEGRFRQSVVDDFADSYVRGETPVPCVRCNQRIKFDDLLNMASTLGADAMATGHYVRRIEGSTGPELHRATDRNRDQSYFLSMTTRNQLSRLLFPLGGMAKSDVRRLAAELGLSVSDKADSQDICFVPDGDYARVVEKLRPEARRPGEIVHVDGRVMGRHDGVLRFTVGQRRGLGIGGRHGEGDVDPLYVVRIEPDCQQVVVGPREALAVGGFCLAEVNWLTPEPLTPEPLTHALPAQRRVEVRLRSAGQMLHATIAAEPDRAGGAYVVLDDAELGVAPGQACVIYAAGRVLGGGWIRRDGLESAWTPGGLTIADMTSSPASHRAGAFLTGGVRQP